MGQIELESAKYLQKAMHEEQVRWRHARTEKTIQSLATLSFVIAALVVAFWAVQEKDMLLPVVREFIAKF